MDPVPLRRKVSCLALLVWFGPICILVAQQPITPLAAIGTAVPAPASKPPTPPVPSVLATPVDFFRELLVARPAIREKLLVGKTPEQRRVLENSLRAYEALPSAERDLRLRTMELRFRLSSLLRVPQRQRDERLRALPEPERRPLQERLRLWDQLSPLDQRQLLENEQAIRIFTGVAASSPRPDASLTGQTSNQVRQIESQLIRWQSLPEARRVEIQKIFTRVFELSIAQKAEFSLPPLPLTAEERRTMEASLDQFRSLDPVQREQCIRNFKKFAALTPAERKRFLAGAQEWEHMKPEDRDAWRKLVSHMPPLPPRLFHPPLPPTARTSPSASSASATSLHVTNNP